MPCCFVRIHATLGTMLLKRPRHSTILYVRFEELNLFNYCVQCHSKVGNRCFTIIFYGAYFLLAVMVGGDESSWLRMAN